MDMGGPPKTNHGIRTIKMTEKAYEILMAVKNGHSNINDRAPEEFKDIPFINIIDSLKKEAKRDRQEDIDEKIGD